MSKVKILIILVFFPLFSRTFAQDFDISITVTDGPNTQVLVIGLDPRGRNGYDPGLDVFAPPPPPSGAFDARLSILNEDYLTDIRGSSLDEEQFHISFQPASGLGPIELSWDSSSLITLGTFSIVDDNSGTQFGPIDMTTNSSLVVTDPSILNGLRVLVTPICLGVNNPPTLASIPDQTMNEGDTLVVSLSATDPNGDMITLRINNLPPFVNFADTVDTTIFITPGFDDMGVYPNIELVATDHGCPSLSDTVSFTLTVNNVNRAPVAENDSVTTSEDTWLIINVLANDFDRDGDALRVISNSQPTGGKVLTYENSFIRYTPDVNFFGSDGFEYTISDGFLNDTAIVSIIVLPVIVNVDNSQVLVPKVHSLEQNYPNPFNPTTRIGYALPEESQVTLRIYDLLGQGVITLVDDRRNPGYYEVMWHGRNSAGVQISGGIYFYRFVAIGTSGQSFTDLKKMLMLK